MKSNAEEMYWPVFKVVDGKIFIMSTYDGVEGSEEKHTHYYSLDMQGNGYLSYESTYYTKKDWLENTLHKHRHQVIDWVVQEEDGHTHKIDLVGYISAFIMRLMAERGV